MLENCGLWVKKRMNGAGGALDGEARGRAGRGRGVAGCGEGEGKRYCTITSHLLQGGEGVVGIP